MPVHTVQHITVRPVTVLVFTHNFTIHMILSQFARTCLHLSINILTLYMGPNTQTTYTSMFIICMLGNPSENRRLFPLSLGSCCCFQEDLVLINESKHIRCTQKELTHKNGSHLKIQKQNTKDSPQTRNKLLLDLSVVSFFRH